MTNKKKLSGMSSKKVNGFAGRKPTLPRRKLGPSVKTRVGPDQRVAKGMK